LLGASAVQLGSLQSVGNAAGALASLPAGWFVDDYSLKKVFLLGTALLAASGAVYSQLASKLYGPTDDAPPAQFRPERGTTAAIEGRALRALYPVTVRQGSASCLRNHQASASQARPPNRPLVASAVS
jgi:MFS family permease